MMKELKLMEICDIFDGVHETPKYERTGIPFRSVENLYDDEISKFISKSFYDKNYKNKKINGESIYITRIGSIGNVKYINKKDEAYYVTLALLTNIKINSLYLFYSLQSPIFQKEILRNSLLCAFPCKINMENLKKCKIVIHEEQILQKKIGSFFKELDELIELKQNKLNIINKILKYYIKDQINKQPKIKECYVKDIFVITRGKYISKDSLSNNGFPVYSSKTVGDGILGYTHEYLFENALIWSTDGYAGRVKYINQKFNCTNVCGVLLNKEGYANKYMEYYLNTITPKYVANSGIPKLMNNSMANIKINLPTLENQKKVSKLIEMYEELVDSYNQEINLLYLVKKYFLQTMFCE